MALYYSASTPGFFDDAIHTSIPNDAAAITPARHRALLAAQAEGATIVAGPEGRPLIHRPRPTIGQRRATLTAQTRKEAARRIDAVSPIWRQMNDQRHPSASGEARFAAIDAIRTASDTIEAIIMTSGDDALTAFGVAAHPAWPKE